jgi:uncharacterized protein (DUF305 family)
MPQSRRGPFMTLALALAVLLLLALAPLASAQHGGGHGMPAGSAASAQPAGAPFARLMDQAMKTMDTGMTAAPMTGDADHDFAAMMIPHHQGAIDMAKAELLHGKNPVLRRLAQEIIVTQGSEIAVMQAQLAKAAAAPAPLSIPARR